MCLKSASGDDFTTFLILFNDTEKAVSSCFRGDRDGGEARMVGQHGLSERRGNEDGNDP